MGVDVHAVGDANNKMGHFYVQMHQILWIYG